MNKNLENRKVLVLKPLGFFLSSFFIACFWVLSPLVKIKVGGLIAQRIGHLALNTDLFFRRQQIYGKPGRTRYIFIAGRVANRQLFNMWKKHMTIIESRLLRGLFHYSEWLWMKTPFYEPLPMNTNEYYEFNHANPTLSFTPEENKRGENFLKQFGIDPKKDWFVCVFARDPEYLKKEFGHQGDWSHHINRNADIETFRSAVDYIVEKGGSVFRIGQHVSKPFPHQSHKVIDYATQYRDEFMDVYLVARCRFLLGTTSGICDLAMVFDTPRLTTNAAPPTDAPNGKRCLFIPKKVKFKATKQPVPFGKFINQTKSPDDTIAWFPDTLAAAGYEYENNTEEEILSVTKEMIERLDGEFLPTEEDKDLQKKYFQLFPEDHWASGVKTPIGRDFLKKHEHLL